MSLPEFIRLDSCQVEEVAAFADVDPGGFPLASKVSVYAFCFVYMPAQEVTRRNTVDKARDRKRTEVASAEALIERRVFGRTVADEDEGIELSKSFEVAGELWFCIFARGIEGRGVRIAEGGEMNFAELAGAGVHIFKTVSFAK